MIGHPHVSQKKIIVEIYQPPAELCTFLSACGCYIRAFYVPHMLQVNGEQATKTQPICNTQERKGGLNHIKLYTVKCNDLNPIQETGQQ